MGLRFRKRIKILPGITLNLSKSGVSTSIGKKGLTVNVGHGKTRTTVGIPGTGMSYSTTRDASGSSEGKSGSNLFGLLLIFGVIVLLLLLILR